MPDTGLSLGDSAWIHLIVSISSRNLQTSEEREKIKKKAGKYICKMVQVVLRCLKQGNGIEFDLKDRQDLF